MRKPLSFLLLSLWLAVSPASARSEGIYNPGSNSVGDYQGIDNNAASGGGTGCAQATTFLARTSGLSGTETTAYTTMICGLVTDGIITGTLSGGSGCGTVLDALYILATKDRATAELNLCGTNFTLVPFGSFIASGFTADTGWAGDSVSGSILQTQFTPSTAGGNFSLNSASPGVYNRTSRTSGTFADIGAQDSGAVAISWIILTGTNTFYDVNEASLSSPTTSNAQGFWATSRTSSSLTSLYKNASSTAVATNATASVSLTNNFIAMGAATATTGGTGGGFGSTDQIAAAWIGGGLTGAQYLIISNRINAYMTALGINVY